MDDLISVLVADDDRGLRESLVDALTDRGMVAHAADSGTRAVAIARRIRIHVGILDVHMPGLTGLEACRRIHEVVGALPLILMSGAMTEDLASHALDAGAASFLPKPLDIRVLLRTLDDLVRSHYGFGRPHGRRFGF